MVESDFAFRLGNHEPNGAAFTWTKGIADLNSVRSIGAVHRWI